MPSKKKDGGAKPKQRRVPKGVRGDAVELREAAKEGDLAQVKSLATLHMIDDPDESGFTALLWAAWHGHKNVVAALLNKGADKNWADEDGQTALFHACWYGYSNVVQLLLSAGCDPDVADNEKETPLGAAARQGHYDCVRLLIQANADPRVRDKDGHNAVSRALKKGSTAIALLIEDYARVYSPQGTGTVVHNLLAVADGNKQQLDLQRRALQLAHQPAGARHPSQAQCAPPSAHSSYGEARAVFQQHPHHQPISGYGQGAPPAGLSGLQAAVAGLDSLQAQLQGRLDRGPGSPEGVGSPGVSAAAEKGAYDSLTVLAGDVVRVNAGNRRLPAVGSAVHLRATGGVVWRAVAVVKGGGVKLQAVGAPGPHAATSVWGEPGDEAGAGLWQSVPSEPPSMGFGHHHHHPPPGSTASTPSVRPHPSPGCTAHTPPPPQQQFRSYQPLNTPPAGGRQGLPANLLTPQRAAAAMTQGQICFGAAGAREAAMPLAGMPPAGSPRQSRYKSGYKKDNPAYRAKNSCTVCLKVRPPLNFCEHCNEEMCAGCWVREHQNRKRRLHIPHPVIVVDDDEDDEDSD
ncbi:hypothetical protein DIPPA_12900 [Diplonema papillatum]|nr:hypothetical protein DIPPA_12900 [Diplonema papillatum]